MIGNIKDLLLAASGNSFKEKERLSTIASILQKEINATISIDHIKIKNSILFIQVKPIVKAEIVLHKEKILAKLNKVLLKHPILDVR